MTRTIALVSLLIVSCAHDFTRPLSQAGSLLEALAPEGPPPACSGVVALTGRIGDSADFVAALNTCRDQAVVVEIDSPGGSVFGAIEIQKAIERHPHPVICVVDGMAASAAFTTLQACPARAMTSRSVLMVHHASALSEGQNEQHANTLAALKAVDRGMVLFIANRLELQPEDLERQIAGGREWWLGLEDAKAYHAIDFEVSGLAEAKRLAAQR